MESKSSFSLILCCCILASSIFSSHGRVSRMLLQEVEGKVEAPANPPLAAGVGQNSEMAEAENGRSKAGVKPSQTHTSSSWNGQNSPTTDPRQQVPNNPPAFPFPRPPSRNSQSVVRNGNSQSVFRNGRQTVVRNGRQSVVTNGNSESVVRNGNSQSVTTNGGQTVVRNGGQTVVINRNGQSRVYNSPTGESMMYNSPPAPTTESMEYSSPTSSEQSSTEGPTGACNWNNADCNP